MFLVVCTVIIISISWFSDKTLHEQALEEGLSNHLFGIIRSTLSHMDQSMGHSREGEGQGVGLLQPCLECLLALVSAGDGTRAELRNSPSFLISLFTGQGSN